MKVNDKSEMTFLDGEPEDANLCRDFSDVFGIVGLLQAAFEAGKAGEELEVTSTSVDSFDDLE